MHPTYIFQNRMSSFAKKQQTHNISFRHLVYKQVSYMARISTTETATTYLFYPPVTIFRVRFTFFARGLSPNPMFLGHSNRPPRAPTLRGPLTRPGLPWGLRSGRSRAPRTEGSRAPPPRRAGLRPGLRRLCPSLPPCTSREHPRVSVSKTNNHSTCRASTDPAPCPGQRIRGRCDPRALGQQRGSGSDRLARNQMGKPWGRPPARAGGTQGPGGHDGCRPAREPPSVSPAPAGTHRHALTGAGAPGYWATHPCAGSRASALLPGPALRLPGLPPAPRRGS